MESNLAYEYESWDELIDGKTVAMSPRPSINHNIVAGNIYRIFGNFLDGKSCIPFGDGTDLYLNEKERYVPDGMIVCNKNIIQHDGIYGTPDLVVEVLSPSSTRYDRGHKKNSYQRAGVREYWIVEPATKTIEVYILKDGQYILDNVYCIYPDFMLEKMNAEERSAIASEFKCSLFDDLSIHLVDVFSRVF